MVHLDFKKWVRNNAARVGSSENLMVMQKLALFITEWMFLLIKRDRPLLDIVGTLWHPVFGGIIGIGGRHVVPNTLFGNVKKLIGMLFVHNWCNMGVLVDWGQMSINSIGTQTIQKVLQLLFECS